MKPTPDRAIDLVYDAAHLAALGVTRDEFEEDPQATLDSVGQYDAIDLLRAGFRPLLPTQVRLRQQLERIWLAAGNPAARRARTYADPRQVLGLPARCESPQRLADPLGLG